MVKQYCISETGDKIEDIIGYAEREPCVELTRQGKTVAVVLSPDEYRRLAGPNDPVSPQDDLWLALKKWMVMHDREGTDLDDVFLDIRDRSPDGR